MIEKNNVEIWGGLECTINRVGDRYFDQSHYAGHYTRGIEDIDLIVSLGITTLRYPLLWERHQPQPHKPIDWSFASSTLSRMQEQGITPIAGLLHHGSGPAYVNFFDGSFEKGLEAYAEKAAQQFPWIEYYTPVNEPLTTARFCGLYGHWYPHGKNDYSFFKILISECKATVLAMRAIRKINPDAKLVQTEDLGKCYSTTLLEYQARLENNRRWLSYDLLCGKVNEQHAMWRVLIQAGIPAEDIRYFTENPCIPWVAGFNYYITSERFLDEDRLKYPEQYHGGNGIHNYADIETVKVTLEEASGPAVLLKEAWDHLQLPLAITECHLHSAREDQLRWFHAMWQTTNTLHQQGVPVKAITAWALFGLWGWNRLVTKPRGDYEPGIFNIRSGSPKPTALAHFIKQLTNNNAHHHPVLEGEGWWQRANRQQYGTSKVLPMKKKKAAVGRPLLVLGKKNILGTAFSRACEERQIQYVALDHSEININDAKDLCRKLAELNPWAVINATSHTQTDKAEQEQSIYFKVNCTGPANLAALCRYHNAQFLHISSDQVFDGTKVGPYTESDKIAPRNACGNSSVAGEGAVLVTNPDALVVRTGPLFGPWDSRNFVYQTLMALKEGKDVEAASDIFMSPTYVPDLAHRSLDLLLDEETGIFHIANDAVVSWKEWAQHIALATGYDAKGSNGFTTQQQNQTPKQPTNTALRSEKGIHLPSLDHALERYLLAIRYSLQPERIAV